MRIVTISREFGSGGRELGKALAEALGVAYYDREIIEEVARRSSVHPDYVENALQRGELPCGDVWRVGGDDVVSPEPVEKVAGPYLQFDAVPFGVFCGKRTAFRADVAGGHAFQAGAVGEGFEFQGPDIVQISIGQGTALEEGLFPDCDSVRHA